MVSPFYEEVAHPPLFIWDPRSRRQGERCDALVQMIDIPATLLEYFGVDRPKDMMGVPLRETLATNKQVRDAAIFGIHGGYINITDGRYVYMLGSATHENQPLYNYTVMATHMRKRFSVEELQQAQFAEPFTFTKDCPLLKIPTQRWAGTEQMHSLLFDVEADPWQHSPLHDPVVEERLKQQMIVIMQANDAPLEQYERMGLAVPV
jgi:hypothetical protein